MQTVHVYRNYGVGEVYGYMPDIYVHSVHRLTDLIKHVRDAMEEGYERIAVFDEEGDCSGLWIDESEPEPDGEGGMMLTKPSYHLLRPDYDNAAVFNRAVDILYNVPTNAHATSPQLPSSQGSVRPLHEQSGVWRWIKSLKPGAH